MKWLRRSAEQGYSYAQNALGKMYLGYNNIPRNYAVAMDWFFRAANSYSVDAMLNLGMQYQLGQGVQLNYIEAYKWFELAASKAESQEQNNSAVSAREFIASQITPKDIARARELARNGRRINCNPIPLFHFLRSLWFVGGCHLALRKPTSEWTILVLAQDGLSADWASE